MKWMIVTDSSCDLKELETGSQDIGFSTVPFHMTLENKEYIDDEDMDVGEMVDAMEKANSSHSACPSPEAWEQQFLAADRSIAFTISSQLSGSYNSAMTAKQMVLEQHPEKQIEVIDALSTGPKLVMLVQTALKGIQESLSFEKVVSACQEAVSNIRTIFTLASFHNLVQNGRVSKMAGFIAGKLNIRVIGTGTDEGTIHLKELVHGEKRTLRNIVLSMASDGYEGQPLTISECQNRQMADELIRMIQEKWKGAVAQVLPTRGLDSYYAERGGLIISYPGKSMQLRDRIKAFADSIRGQK